MKVLIVVLLLLTLVISPSPELEKCIEDKCPDQYKKCKSTKGCEDKLNKCADKCGEKFNQSCWTSCLGLIPGAATNVALCAVNQGCISKMSILDRLTLTLQGTIEHLNSQ